VSAQIVTIEPIHIVRMVNGRFAGNAILGRRKSEGLHLCTLILNHLFEPPPEKFKVAIGCTQPQSSQSLGANLHTVEPATVGGTGEVQLYDQLRHGFR